MTSSHEARLLLLGWNFRAAGSAVRERVAFTADEIREVLRGLLGRGIVSEGVIVSTCHRSEIYGVTEPEGDGEGITRFVSEWRGLDPGELALSGFQCAGGEAARHLFRVASGLDSLAIGESEVLGQVRQALRLAREAGTSRTLLHRLFESALAAGKRVRTETEIATHPLSVASIGFELATKVFGELAGRTILLLGAGETATLFARHARDSGVSDLRIANRTHARAEEVAGQVGGRAIPWESYAAELASADVVVGATSSPEPIVRRAEVEAAMRARRGRPMFFLDLAVPRDIDPSLREIYNVFAYGLEDLEEVAEENRRRRARDVPRAESIVEEELQRFLAWLGNLSVAPTIADLRHRLNAARDAELARVPAPERDKLRAFADALLSRMVHAPVHRLKTESDLSRKLDRVEAIRHLFHLDDDEGAGGGS